MSAPAPYASELRPNAQAPADCTARIDKSSCCIWFSGLPGAGKTSLARAIEKRIYRAGRRSYLFGGESFRLIQPSDFEATKAEHLKHVHRLAEAAHVVVEAGSTVLVTLFSPFSASRQIARRLFEKERFVEVYVDTPLEICALSVPKGLCGTDPQYREQELRKFWGMDSRYELPLEPEIRVDMSLMSLEDCADRVFEVLPAFTSAKQVQGCTEAGRK